MKQVALALSIFLAFAQPSADYIILVEASQLTCGAPILSARSALKQVLCGKPAGRVAIGTFYRKHNGRYIDWLTTPILEAEGYTCNQVLQNLRPRCDSIYAVELLGALEEALRGEFVRAPKLILLASGSDNSPGLRYDDIVRLADARQTTIYALSIGWGSENQAAQTLLKRLSGQFEGGSSQQYALVKPNSGDLAEGIAQFLQNAIGSPGVPSPPAEPSAGMPGTSLGGEQSPLIEKATLKGGSALWHWILIGAGTLVVVGVIIALTSGNKQPQAPAVPPPAPAPAPVQPPSPVIRRLIVYYPHGHQDVQLPPSTAPITLGRAPDNTIVINDPTVSSRHARLFLQGSWWYIQDLGSTNGTFVNNNRITQHPIQIGDQLRLGAIVIQIAG